MLLYLTLVDFNNITIECCFCYVVLGGNWQFSFLILGVLVGAFSVFGVLDTGNPVQNYALFLNFTLNPFPEGLI